MSDDGIFERYHKEISDIRSPNQLLISEGMRSPLTKALFIPGSSIKGAIRTAIIDYLDIKLQLGLKDQGVRYHQVLEQVLGPIRSNSFQALKIGDFPAPVDDALLVEPKELRLKTSDRASTPKNLCETTRNLIMAPDEIHELFGRVSLGQDLQKPVLKLARGEVVLEIEKLFQICTDFYKQRYEAEKKKFYQLGHFSSTKKVLEFIDPKIESIGPKQMLLRIGHYSHVECMTVTNNDPRTPVRKGKKMPFGTTRTLANGIYPFGWVILSICSEDEFLREEKARKQHDRETIELREKARASSLQEFHEAALQAAKRKAEEKKRAEEEKQRQKDLEDMPEDKRLLMLLTQDKLNENQVIEFYDLLDTMDEETRLAGAKALKAYWKQNNAWNVKRKIKKQYEKVQKIKGILNE